MATSLHYVLATVGLVLLLLSVTAIMFWLLGIDQVIKDLMRNKKRRTRSTRAEEIELEQYTDVQKRAKERRRKEAAKRWEESRARREGGYFAGMGKAYHES
ncbi:hypothetical protein P153DRAFT_363858 [Dothidotthia symphoricarpi CBS 119687]|uniref:Uncharacterized protein n=1 Tax=Dothidotthia symphoricarpi CBS 119687 TaxID=1392245 RepID=A0A6A6AN26_9PLEO|nr:uncharacterized protein P153DRAFT_363858 [Dothidotthia symphoricarpi CBS 119687]KAF2132548.1 hypothetical protein P153DRAFT_363858 [Dothidotthia symphoricarpi CBS 119687]